MAKNIRVSSTMRHPATARIQHIGAEQFMQQTGIDMTHVPYKGAGPAMTDLLGGVVDVFITTPPSAVGHVRNGAVKALAPAGSERLPMLPDVPTMAEAGVPGFELEAWFALYAPAGTPQPIIDALARRPEGGRQRGLPAAGDGSGNLRRLHGAGGARQVHRE